MVNIDDLQISHGLIATKNMIWSEAMDRIADKDRAYITALLRRGEKFNGVPRITVSTIHGSKGGEADNVVLFTDLSPAADSTMRIARDDVHRIFYVGVTRTRQNLYLVEPEGQASLLTANVPKITVMQKKISNILLICGRYFLDNGSRANKSRLV